MRQGRFAMLDCWDETSDEMEWTVEGYTTGERWNGWSVPFFTHKAASQLVVHLTEFFTREDDLTPPEGTGGYDVEHDSFFFYLRDDSQYAYEDVLLGKGFTTSDGLKLYPFGGGAWCWTEVGVHFTENA